MQKTSRLATLVPGRIAAYSHCREKVQGADCLAGDSSVCSTLKTQSYHAVSRTARPKRSPYATLRALARPGQPRGPRVSRNGRLGHRDGGSRLTVCSAHSDAEPHARVSRMCQALGQNSASPNGPNRVRPLAGRTDEITLPLPSSFETLISESTQSSLSL